MARRRLAILLACLGPSLAGFCPSAAGAEQVPGYVEALGLSESREAAAEKHIALWTHAAVATAEFDALKVAADKFNAGNRGFRVDVYPTTFRSYAQQVDRAALSGELPCLLEADGPFLYGMAWRGYLQPIDKFMPDELLNDMLPSILAQGRYDGRLYSLGQFDSGLGLWGNRRLLRQAGVRIPTLQKPWTLDEFEVVLDKLSQLPGVSAAIEMGTYMHSGEFYPYAYAPILQGFGADLIDRDAYRSAKGVLDGAQAVAAMSHFQQWFKNGWAKADVVLEEADGSRKVSLSRIDESSTRDFVEGKAALAWQGHWQYPWYKQTLGNDLLLLPLPDFGHGIKTGMGSWSYAMSSTCSDPQASAAFLRFLLSDAEVRRMTEVNGAVPARRSLLAKSSLYGKHGPLRLYAEQLEAGLAVPRPNTPAYATISKVFSNAVAAMLAGSDVQVELSKAAALIDEDIAANRGYAGSYD